MNYELKFLIMVKGNLDKRQLSSLMLTLPKAEADHVGYILFEENWIDILNNDFADATLAEDPTKGYLHFPFRIECYPLSDDVTLEHQIKIARYLKTFLENTGLTTDINADFEALL